ncbi:pyruvate kinase [Reyranella sp. MMS21-HV4-11]|uniref:Pyruvate kinase n=1 Tax=Reyranella humidisoli TaxID=2849149 RepID=A0ABS6IL96_9HYPH|nr:pyruvate kinase [Reyranella sp. MMS21-HV4-11]MBU8875369.1 pyruvate kinase [Reyranella sp. MMS21-HV4-11]
MRRNRFTKIVATLGPSSSNTERLRTLFEAGADVFRLNFSHGQHEDHRKRVNQLRALEKEYKHPIAILMDLQGPKLRLGTFAKGPMDLKKDQKLRFDMDPTPGTAKRVPLLHPEIFKAAKPDGLLLVDDGKVRLRIVRHDAETIDTVVEVAGTISDRKGVNLPNLVLPMSPMTPKDHKDLVFGLSLGVDWVALSFVQHANDIAELKKLVAGRAAVMAKLEKPQAIEHLDEIIEQSDGIMVARGDLGVEMPPEAVPPLQKRILAACRAAGRPTIVATQMLESMIHSPTPTRAEVSDVATAVYDGTDAVMLSAESASGDYPIEAVTIMDRILKSVEGDPLYRRLMDASRREPEATTADAISAAARQCAHTLSAAAIVTYTNTGSTTLRAARERPDVRILCLTPNLDTARRMTLTWGVLPVQTEDAHNFADMVQRAVRIARQQGIAKEGERLVVTAGVPFGTPGATNILRIAYV